jgi:hypothetical protein
MIGQYLPNNNENATVPILQKNLHLNRAIAERAIVSHMDKAIYQWTWTRLSIGEREFNAPMDRSTPACSDGSMDSSY